MNENGWKLVDLDDIKLVRVPSIREAGSGLVQDIINSSFMPRGLQLADDYEATRPDNTSVWIAYKRNAPAGIAVVEPVSGSAMAYLDKLGVVPEWQRNGVAKALWDQVAQDNPKLCLRANAANTFNKFYEERCDTRLPYGGWIVYTNGVAPADLPKAHDYAIEKPATLVRL